MLLHWRYLALAAVLAVSVRLISGPAASQESGKAAQSMPIAVVGVIDFQRVVKESAAGKSVRQQIDARRAKFQAEIRTIQQELETARSALAARPTETPDGEYARKREEMRKRVGELQSMLQNRKRELDDMFNYGMRQIDLSLIEVLKELAEERRINLILNAGRGRGLVLFAENRIVITEEALRRLDARLPEVGLTDVDVGK